MSCCINYLGSFPHSDHINTGLSATVDGVYIFEIEFAGAKFYKTQTVIGADPISPVSLIIPKLFNENYTYKLKIKKPDGTYLSVNGCSDHSFKTFVLITDGCGDDCEFEYN